MSARLEMMRGRSCPGGLLVLCLAASSAWPQGLGPTTPSREYIRMGSRVIATESKTQVSNGPPEMSLDAPQPGNTMIGDYTIFGWAKDVPGGTPTAIQRIDIYVDNVLINEGVNVYGTMDRPELCNPPNTPVPGCPKIGWQFLWNTRQTPNGSHTIRVVATDSDVPTPRTVEVVRSFVINNPIPVKPQPQWLSPDYGERGSDTFSINFKQGSNLVNQAYLAFGGGGVWGNCHAIAWPYSCRSTG